METLIRVDWLTYLATQVEILRVAMKVGTFGDEARVIKDSQKALSDVKPTLLKCGLPLTVRAADRLEKKLADGGHKKSDLASDAASFLQRMSDELSEKKFYVTTRSIGASPKNPFGDGVSGAFPEIAADIDDAQRCLWNGQGTATVFHLMRVMERFVKIIGRKLKAKTSVETANWGQITSQLDQAMRALPTKTPAQRAKRDALAATLAHLNAVRIAWRNPVMHPKAHYSVEEAQQIFDQVKIFAVSMVAKG